MENIKRFTFTGEEVDQILGTHVANTHPELNGLEADVCIKYNIVGWGHPPEKVSIDNVTVEVHVPEK
jgi:hypothetical protein